MSKAKRKPTCVGTNFVSQGAGTHAFHKCRKSQSEEYAPYCESHGLKSVIFRLREEIEDLTEANRLEAPASYIVVEEITGLIDGYFSKEEAIEVLEYWDKTRPQNKHFLFGGFKNPYERMKLTENLHMRIIDREEDGYIQGEEQ